MHSIKQRLIDKKRILRVGMSTETDLVSDGDENKQNLACDSKSQSVMFTVDYLLHPTSTDIDITSDTWCVHCIRICIYCMICILHCVCDVFNIFSDLICLIL